MGVIPFTRTIYFPKKTPMTTTFPFVGSIFVRPLSPKPKSGSLAGDQLHAVLAKHVKGCNCWKQLDSFSFSFQKALRRLQGTQHIAGAF